MAGTARAGGRERFDSRAAARIAAACLLVGLASAAACLGLNMAALPWILDRSNQWFAPADIWQSIQAARFVANGAILFMYGAPETMSHGGYQYPPVWPVLMAPAVGVGDALGLVDNRVFAVPRPTMMIPLVLVASTVTTSALAASVWRVTRSCAPASRRGAIAAVVLAAFMAMGVFFHGEDLLLIAFMLMAATASGTGAGWVVAGLLTKQTMIAFAPALLAGCDPRDRRRFLLIALAVPPAVMVPFLAATPTDLLRAFGGPESLVASGARALWAPLIWGDAEAVPGNPSRMLWIAVSVAVAWLWRHRCRDTGGLLAVLTAVGLMRPLLFEPVVYAYYWATPLALTAVWATLVGRRRWTLIAGIAAVYLWYLADPPDLLWWAATAALAAGIWAPILRTLGPPRPRIAPGSRRLDAPEALPTPSSPLPECH